MGVFLLLAFICLGHEHQDLWSLCDGMHVCMDKTSIYTLTRKSFGGMESEPMLTPRGKSPLPEKILPRGGLNPRHCIKQDSEPSTLSTSYPGPIFHCITLLSASDGTSLNVGCLTSQQHANVFQGQICSGNCMSCLTEIEVANPTFHLTQSQYTDTQPTNPSTDLITPGASQDSHWECQFLSH